MFVKKKNLRKAGAARKIGADSDEDDATPAAPTAVAKPAGGKAKGPRPAKAALVSFDDDEEEPVVIIKPKKKLGGGGPKMSKKADRAKEPPAGPTASYFSSSGEYSKEKMKELSKNALSIPSSAKPAEEPAIRLTGLFKPAAPVGRDDLVSGMDAGAAPAPPPPPPRAVHHAGGGDDSFDRPSARPRAPPPLPEEGESEAGGEEDDGGQFVAPDEATIRAAKAKREKMRNAHSARPADYVALDGPGRAGGGEDKGCGSESDEEHEDDQDLRVKFGVGDGAGGRGRGGGRSVLPQQEDAAAAAGERGRGGGGDEDDEEDLFIMEQIRKGVGAGNHPAARPEPAAPRPLAAGRAAGAAGAAGVLATLESSLARAQESHRTASQQHRRAAAALQASVEAVARLEEGQEAAQSKFDFLQELKAYVADLCLADKGVLVEELEEHVAKLHESRLGRMTEWRATEEEEASGIAEVSVAAALMATGQGPAAARAAADAAEADAESAATKGLRVELDEFGRDENAERRHAAERRLAKRRARAQRARERRAAAAAADPLAGESDTEESEGEVARFRAGREEAVAAMGTVFADASEEFGTLEGVKRHLEGFKQRFPGQYRDAYVPLTAPQIFAPFARLELIGWSIVHPLAGGGGEGTADVGFDGHKWYTALFDYGMPPEGGEVDPDDPDGELIPKLVEKVVLPAALHMVAGGWDPRSARQTRHVVAGVRELLVYIPAEAEMLRTLLLEVQDRLAAAAGRVSVPAWPPAALAAAVNAGELVARRFGAAVRVMLNAGMWEGILERHVLEPVILDGLLTRALVPHLRMLATGDVPLAAARAARAAGAVPRAWLAGGCPAGARPLLDLARNMAMQVQQGAAGHAAARDVAATLEILGDRERAAAVLRARP